MRKILAIVLTFCTVFSSICTIALARDQLSSVAGVSTVSGSDGQETAPGNEEKLNEVPGDRWTDTIVTENYTLYYLEEDQGIIIVRGATPFISDADIGEVMIPEDINGKPVYRIDDHAFESFSQITGSFSLPDSITEVGEYAFAGCSNFSGTLPPGLEVIGASAFYNCSGFTGELALAEGIEEIGSHAFDGCSGLTGEIRLPDSLKSIGGAAFNKCSGFTGGLKIPTGLTEIAAGTFRDCTGLSGTLELPEGLLKIGDNAFYSCYGLTGELKLPEGLTEIGASAFSGRREDGEGYGCPFTGSLIIPDSVVRIGDCAFDCCRDFTGDLKLPSGLKIIGSATFNRCSGFSGELILPEALEEIYVSAFHGCSGFTGELKLPDGLQAIRDYAFSGCSGFTGDLVIPDSVSFIGGTSFMNCDSLGRDVYMTGSISEIGSNQNGKSAFYRIYDRNTDEAITVADIVIHAPKGSYAEEYARANGYSYMDEEGNLTPGKRPEPESPDPIPGENPEPTPTPGEDPEPVPTPGEEPRPTPGGASGTGLQLIQNATAEKVTILSLVSGINKVEGLKDGEYLRVNISDHTGGEIMASLEKAAADAGIKIISVLDIVLEVLNGKNEHIREVGQVSGAITFIIATPEGMDGKLYDFVILRMHGGNITVLNDQDDDPDTITFSSDRFSEYAIAYKAKGSSTGNTDANGTSSAANTQKDDDNSSDTGGNGNANSGNSNNNSNNNGRSGSGQATRDGVPKTGDKLPIAVPATATVIFAVLSCILGGQELLGRRAKKAKGR